MSNSSYKHTSKEVNQLRSKSSKGAFIEDNRGASPVQKKANKTGLPDQLKGGIEGLSGLSMDDVKVHYNSNKPAQLNAHAYAQGTDIHIGAGQEKHLPHEAWHVVQQKEGRVKPTMQMNNVSINDNIGLEKEADVMGGKATQLMAIPKNDRAVVKRGIQNPSSIALQRHLDTTQLMWNPMNLVRYAAGFLHAIGIEKTLHGLSSALKTLTKVLGYGEIYTLLISGGMEVTEAALKYQEYKSVRDGQDLQQRNHHREVTKKWNEFKGAIVRLTSTIMMITLQLTTHYPQYKKVIDGLTYAVHLLGEYLPTLAGGHQEGKGRVKAHAERIRHENVPGRYV